MVGAVAAMFFGTFLGMCIYARIRSQRALAEDLRVRTLVDAARATSVRDAPVEGSIVISGRVSSAESAVVSAPFSGGDALWAQATAQTNIGGVIDRWVRAVDTIVVDDGSGRVANVQLAGATIRLTEKSLSGEGAATEKRIAAFLASTGRAVAASTSDTAEFYYEAVLRPGDTISVLGTLALASGAGYRESAASIALTSDAGELLLFDGAADAGAPTLHRGYIRAANLGIAFFGLATAISLAFALG